MMISNDLNSCSFSESSSLPNCVLRSPTVHTTSDTVTADDGADDRPAGGAHLAAAVGRPGGVRGEHRHQRLHVAARGRLQELGGDLRVALRVRGVEPSAPGPDMLTRPVREAGEYLEVKRAGST